VVSTGARLLIDRLKAHGVDVIFGVPGIHNLAIYDALVDEPSIRVVTTGDERGAGHMAEGYARATGRPGVCLTVPGPGVTNALTAIGEAYADSSGALIWRPRDVALFLPCRCNKGRQTAAKRDTKRKRKIIRFQRVKRADQQGNATSGKGRLPAFFPPVNRRVAGSNPA
jgi:hypothetical protein